MRCTADCMFISAARNEGKNKPYNTVYLADENQKPERFIVSEEMFKTFSESMIGDEFKVTFEVNRAFSPTARDHWRIIKAERR